MSVEDLDQAMKRFRRIAGVSPGEVSANLRAEICCVDVAVRRGFATELAQRIRDGGVRRIEKYARAAIRTACAESGVDVSAFKEAVKAWIEEHVAPTRTAQEATS